MMSSMHGCKKSYFLANLIDRIPQLLSIIKLDIKLMVGRVGFEPTYSEEARFTVWCASPSAPPAHNRPGEPYPSRAPSPDKLWLQGLDLNQRPSGYEPDELPDCSTLLQKMFFKRMKKGNFMLESYTLEELSRQNKQL